MQSAVSSERRRRPLLGPLWLQVLVAIARGAAMGSLSRWEHAFDAEHAAAVLNRFRAMPSLSAAPDAQAFAWWIYAACAIAPIIRRS